MADKSQDRDTESYATEYRRAYVKIFSMNSDAGVNDIMAIHNELSKTLTGVELRNAVITKMKNEHPESPLSGTVATRGEHSLTQGASHEQDVETHKESEED